MQERLKALEAQYQTPTTNSGFSKDDEEDWKEMYYEENEVKEKLENELDITPDKDWKKQKNN